jgi:hypothetical protein
MPVIGLASVVGVVVISAGPTLSQTNIDQGKPASELFANYCAVCHKSTRGLANGRSGLSLSLFLREHYATSSQQAAALAAYVINAGGNAPAAKLDRAKPDEAKGQETKGQEAKGHEVKPHPASAKSEPEKSGGQPGREETVPAQEERTPVVAAPAAGASPTSGEAPEPTPPTSAGVSAESQSNDNALSPRDNIPD